MGGLPGVVGEAILSGEELDGLMTELLVSHEAPRGAQSVVGWLGEHGPELGQAYASKFTRHVHHAADRRR